MEILQRLKSPVVITQLVSIVAAFVVVILPQFDGVAQEIAIAVATIINIVAGLNNPTDPENF